VSIPLWWIDPTVVDRFHYGLIPLWIDPTVDWSHCGGSIPLWVDPTVVDRSHYGLIPLWWIDPTMGWSHCGGSIPLWVDPTVVDRSHYGLIPLWWIDFTVDRFHYGWIPLWTDPTVDRSHYGSPATLTSKHRCSSGLTHDFCKYVCPGFLSGSSSTWHLHATGKMSDQQSVHISGAVPTEDEATPRMFLAAYTELLTRTAIAILHLLSMHM